MLLPVPIKPAAMAATMTMTTASILLLSSLLSPLVSAAATVVFTIPPSAQIPNPASLPPSTHATLTSLGTELSAPITTNNSFVFRNVSAGSYLADVYCATHGFAPLRVDVVPALLAAEDSEARKGLTEKDVEVRVWETFRGNDWDNKGELVRPITTTKNGATTVAVFPVKVLGSKVFYMERGSFSVLSILKNPMILMGLVSLALFVGMPKLVENMDPEMRAEFEEQSRKNPMNSMLAGPQAGSNPMGNFDVAGFLAGQNSNGNGGGAKEEGTVPDQSSGRKGGRR